MNDRLAVAAQLLASSPWISAPSSRNQDKLIQMALACADDLISREKGTQRPPPEPKRWFQGVRRLFRFLLERVYR